jgi:hypothetical protein
MIDLRGRISITLFDRWPSPQVILGTHGYLFYAGDGSPDDCLHRSELSPVELDAWAATLHARTEWLSERGIRYLFVVGPNKQTDTANICRTRSTHCPA